jgi:hypothetical protein
MQNIILALVITLFTSVASFAQCDKKVKWQAAKAELVDESGNVVDTKEGRIVITTDAKTIRFEILESENETAEGTVSETTCEWKEAFKNGKSTYKAAMTGRNGDSQNASITVEGKDGKVKLTLELEKLNGKKVIINVDKYEVI